MPSLSYIDSPKRPRRAGHQKSRNGCLTCKIRKVKCDETRPSCRKCTETGRKCEGPVVHEIRFIRNQTQPISRTTTPVPTAEISLLSPHHSQAERRAFDYFMKRAAPVFAGAVDATFWKDLVPQLAHTYSFVWDTVVSLGSLVEHVQYESLTTASAFTTGLSKVTNREHRQALKWYNRAIMSVRQLAEQGQLDDSLVALSYILFASVEFQQRNVDTGTELMKRCCKILAEGLTSLDASKQISISTSTSTPISISPASQTVHQVVTPFVLRKAVVTATLGSDFLSQCGAHINEQVDNTNTLTTALSRSPMLDDARLQFHSLAHDSYEVIRLADFFPHMKDDHPTRVSFLSQRQTLLDELRHWKMSFTTPTTSTATALDADDATACIRSYLLMYWAVCYISLAACVSPHQTVFDQYLDEFAGLIEHATIYLRYAAKSQPPFPPPPPPPPPPPATTTTTFGFDPGVIPPLYFCATKCRHPTLRRQALTLMRQAPRQDNLWAFVAPERVVATLISVEEGTSTGTGTGSGNGSGSGNGPGPGPGPGTGSGRDGYDHQLSFSFSFSSSSGSDSSASGSSPGNSLDSGSVSVSVSEEYTSTTTTTTTTTTTPTTTTTAAATNATTAAAPSTATTNTTTTTATPAINLPPEDHRIAYISVVGRPAPGGTQRQALELCRFRFGPDGSGPRRLVTDYVWLGDGSVG